LSVAATEHLEETNTDLAAAVARHSSHPVSRAIAALSVRDEQFDAWEEVRGAGIEARRGPDIFRIGRLEWLKEAGVTLSQSRLAEEHQGTVVGFAKNGKLISVFALADALKPHAEDVVRKLAAQGYVIYLVTGDNARTAGRIASQLGIPAERVFANIRPEGKLEVVEQVRSQGRRVAFVGDGINDAPALKAADLGIALMNATDVAREQADVVLLNADLNGVAEALKLAQATLRTIKQNLFWAFFYNALGVPLAAAGFLSPMFSALAMGLSDFIVIGNALRLKQK
jgi:Cu+-exporting ATPase